VWLCVMMGEGVGAGGWGGGLGGGFVVAEESVKDRER
jgi:hypothetical protein